ncbi:MAG: starch-binding protein [Prevotella sp.]|nr:starch-binding protein [Prevotella sp.]
MKKYYALITVLLAMTSSTFAQSPGWPENYGGVMLQGFYWIEEPANATKAEKDSIKQEFNSIKWTSLTAQADELSEFFNLIWVPQSGATSSNPSMGYDPTNWFLQNGTFGTPPELRAMTAAFKQRGTGILADIVLNHRKPVSGWLTFANETRNGHNYTLTSEDICANDDGGATAEWAAKNGFSLSPYNDEGDDFSDARDIAHQSQHVQEIVIAYLNYLLNDIGYSGFRLDMVKGYSPYYTGLYNFQTKPQFSVGECWDGMGHIKWWMDQTRRNAQGNQDSNGDVQSGAFDFPLKWKINDACMGGNWLSLYPDGQEALVWDSYWPRWAVTFVDNHDTYREGDKRCTQNELAANAYILSMPGTPCVFMQHWKRFKPQIKQLIYARHLAGVTNQSGIEVKHSSRECLSTRVNGKLEILMGNGFGQYDASEGTDMALVESGENFALYLSKSVNAPWVSLPSGEYEGPVRVAFTALSNNTDKLVYTLDGTTPTAQSQQLTSGASIVLNESATLCVGLLVGSQVVNVQTRNYTVTPGEEENTTVNVFAPQGAPYLYAWDISGTPVNGQWPGTPMSQTITTSNGLQWYTATFNTLGNLNIIFSDGNGNQTADIAIAEPGTHYFTYDGATGYQQVTENYSLNTIATINVSAPSAPNLYAWSSTGEQLCGPWPGRPLSATITHNGKSYYTHKLMTNDDVVNIIFNTANGQTEDILGLTSGTYFYNYDGSTGYELEEVQSVATGIRPVAGQGNTQTLYDLQGRAIRGNVTPQKGIYVRKGKKIIY